jgi:hypothetical protein
MFCQKINIWFIELHHFRGQQKNGIEVYFSMPVKAPAK